MTKGLRFDDDKALAAFLAGKDAARRNKYGAKPETRDGIRHDSKAEANFADELREQERRGEIHDLVLDKDRLRYPLVVEGVMIGCFTADFRYTTKAGQVIVGDVKSAPTAKRPDYRMRRLLMLAIHKIAILEVVR
jgi:hypothetical protein